jgi:hypothetical protein
MHKILTVALLASLATPIANAANAAAADPVNRCGWIVNPTPGNWWLTDSQGDWIIATQGSDTEALGMENIGDISAHDYQATNGNYGYACGCMKVENDESDKRITAIYSFKQLPLSKCIKDKSLPAPE